MRRIVLITTGVLLSPFVLSIPGNLYDGVTGYNGQPAGTNKQKTKNNDQSKTKFGFPVA